MNIKEKVITLALLLNFPVFAQAGVVYLPVQHNVNRGEFASPVGVFNTKLGIPSHGEFKTNGLFPSGSMFKDTHFEELKSRTGEFKFSLP